MTFKIRADQVTVDHDGQVFRHAVLKLSPTQTLASIVENPAGWSVVQGAAGKTLKRGDTVTIISADGLRIWRDLDVRNTDNRGGVFLSKPARVSELEQSALYTDGTNEIVPNGVGFSVRNVATGHVGDRVYSSAEAAKAEALRGQPQKVA